MGGVADGDRVLPESADAQPHHPGVQAQPRRDDRAARSELAEYCDPSTKVGDHRPLQRRLASTASSSARAFPNMSSRPSRWPTSSASSPRIFVDPEAEPIGRSIAFIGAKGGVGSSTIAHNIAWAMSTLFKSEVVVADLDLAFGTANINFDQDPAQGIAEAVFAPERIDEVYLDRLLAQCAEHLSLLAAPSTLDRVYDFDPEAFCQIIDTAQRSAPLLVLDVPHIWNGWSQEHADAKADEIVDHGDAELANLRNTKNIVDMLKKLRPNDRPPKLIINQAGVPKRPEISAADFADPLGITPMAVIPFDAAAVRQRVEQRPHARRDGCGECDRRQIDERDRACADRPQRDQDQEEAGLGSLLGKLRRKK